MSPGVNCGAAVKRPGIGFAVWQRNFNWIAPGSQVVLGTDDVACPLPAGTTYSWMPGGQATRTITVTAPGPYPATQSYTLTTTSGSTVTSSTVTLAGLPNGVPLCTLSAPTTTIAVGQSLTITSSCSPAATNLYWTRYSSDTTGTATFSFAAPGGYITELISSNAAGSGQTLAAGITVVAAGPAAGSIGFATRTTSTTAGGLRPVSMTVRRTGAAASAPAATVGYACTVTTSGGAFAPAFSPAASGTLSFPTPTSTATITAALPEFTAGTTGATITCTLSNPQPAGATVDAATHTITVAAPVFAVDVIRNITPTQADVSATLRFRPQDIGSTGSVYVFAVAPSSIVTGASMLQKDARFAWRPTGGEKDTSVACVLAQLNASGQLQAVSASNIQAYVTGVLSGQGQAVTVLNGVPTANIGGATFYVGYGSSAAAMLNGGLNRSVAAIPGPVTCAPQAPQTGWWWNTAEGGRGYSLEVQGNVVFFAAYLYDVTGRATWTIAAGPTSLDGSLFVGRLESYAGGQSLSGDYHAPGLPGNLGDITLAFNDASHGSLVWPGGTVPIERFNIIPNGLGTTPLANQPENGWWWNPQESGRGYFLEWQGNTLFMAGYMYDAAGNPLWYLTTATAANLQSYAATWWQYGNGQTMTGPYVQPQQLSTNVAALTIQFQGPDIGVMTLPGNKTTTIRRYRF
jgi:hypothetical protein